MAVLGVALLVGVASSFGGHTGSNTSTSGADNGTNSTHSGNGFGGGGASGVTTEPSNGDQSTPAYPAVNLTGQECGRVDVGPYAAAAAANDHTTCTFAMNVRAQYEASGANGSPTTIPAYSPVTKKNYTMQCSGDQPVTCTGGNDAVVYIYGGTASFSG